MDIREKMFAYFDGLADGMKIAEEDSDLPRMIDRKDIEWLIEQYQDEIDKLEEERKTNKGIGIVYAMNCGKIGAYARVVEDLKELLEEDDADE